VKKKIEKENAAWVTTRAQRSKKKASTGRKKETRWSSRSNRNNEKEAKTDKFKVYIDLFYNCSIRFRRQK